MNKNLKTLIQILSKHGDWTDSEFSEWYECEHKGYLHEFNFIKTKFNAVYLKSVVIKDCKTKDEILTISTEDQHIFTNIYLARQIIKAHKRQFHDIYHENQQLRIQKHIEEISS